MRYIVTLITIFVLFANSKSQQLGSIIDKRDAQKYKTIKMGNQLWLAENLNYKSEGSFCYDNNSHYRKTNPIKYGRIYTWYSALISCPQGWHLPSRNEWNKLIEYLGGVYQAGDKLKLSSGFNIIIGFPYYINGIYFSSRVQSNFWTSEAYDDSTANVFWARAERGHVGINLRSSKDSGEFVRCIKD